MNFFDSIILGLVQGITEFLPISSSGHLIIVHEILGVNLNYDLSFDAILQLATAFSILFFFWRKIWAIIVESFKSLKTLWFLIIGTIPAVVVGFLFEDKINALFRHSWLVALALIVGSIIMYLTEKYHTNHQQLNTKKSFLVGVFQALALIPGMSRSGMTISGGYLAGLSKTEAVDWSFILGIPLLFGSGLKKLLDISVNGAISSFGLELLVGSIVAFVVGLISIKFLLQTLKSKGMKPFIWYRVILAAIILIFV